jgi:hypothetical protein
MKFKLGGTETDRHRIIKTCKLTNCRKTSNIPVTLLLLKLFHYTPRRRLGKRMYSSYSFLTSALNGGEWSRPRFSPGKGPPVPIVQEVGWAPEPVWTQRLKKKSFRLCWGSNLDRPVIQPVDRHYTAWATRLTYITSAQYNSLKLTWYNM